MKYIAALALMLNLGVASVYAQRPVKMAYSGTSGPARSIYSSPAHRLSKRISPGTVHWDHSPFVLLAPRQLLRSSRQALALAQLTFISQGWAGAGVFRFQDGSLLKVNMTQGADCIDLAAQQGHCTLTFQITGGTGRFKDASGTLTLTETNVPVLADASNNPVFFASTGEFTGTVSGVSREADRQEERAIGRHISLPSARALSVASMANAEGNIVMRRCQYRAP